MNSLSNGKHRKHCVRTYVIFLFSGHLTFHMQMSACAFCSKDTDDKHRHAKRARVIFCDRSISKTVYSNDLVKCLTEQHTII